MRAPDWWMSTRGLCIVILCTGLVVICYQTQDAGTLAGVVGGGLAGYLFGRGKAAPGACDLS